MAEDILFPPVLKVWATPKEFDTKKLVTVVDFKKYTAEELEKLDGRKPNYPPKGTVDKPVDGQDGYVRRIVFTQEGFNGERRLDINSPSIESDLGNYGIKRGDTGYLSRVKVEGRKAYRWKWEKQ